MLIKTVSWRSIGSLEGGGVEQQCEMCLMGVVDMILGFTPLEVI